MFHAQIAQRAFNKPLLVEPSKAMAFLSGLGPRITGRQLRLAGLEVVHQDYMNTLSDNVITETVALRDCFRAWQGK